MPGSALRFEHSVLQLGRRVTDQQLWCLGCDVRAKGFPLARLGWTHHPRPDKTRGCARISGTLPNEGHLSLWGFGFLACDSTHGALWLGRKSFRPEWAAGFSPNQAVWDLKQIKGFAAPASADQVDCVLVLLAELCMRLAEHEEDVLAVMGEDYRRDCLDAWQFRRRAVEASEMPRTWRHIGQVAREMRRHEVAETTGARI